MQPNVWEIAFWISLALALYTGVGYPLCLVALRRWRRLFLPPSSGSGPEEELPSLSVIVVARNEAERIGPKVRSLLALDYPADRLEVLIASDGSTDDTGARARAAGDPRVRVLEYPTPLGKAAAINRTVPHARGEVLLFTDARQPLDPRAARLLVRPLADPRVGAVGGELCLVDEDGRPSEQLGGLYWRYEVAIRRLEGEVGLLTGLSGCLYALRRAAFQPIPKHCLLDDVAIPLCAAAAGWQLRWEPAARAFDRPAASGHEFRRKVRTLVGNWQLFVWFWRLLLPWRPRFAFPLLSHKLARAVAPLALAVLYASSLSLAGENVGYLAAAAAQTLLYSLGLAAALFAKLRRYRLFNVCFTFCLLNAAALLALLNVLFRGWRVAWR